jgi:hypothetical protein
MTILAVILFVILAAIAALHVVWGAGGLWPARNEPELVALVIGRTGRKKMPSSTQCFVAAGAIFYAGLLALFAANIFKLVLVENIVTMSVLIVAGVFLGRGIAGFLPSWRVHFSQQPFATFDRRYYSPFCFAVAAAFLLLVWSRAPVT